MRVILASSALALVLSTNLSAPARADEAIVGTATITGYLCTQDVAATAKREAVQDAETKCSWEDGRPSVRRVGDWTVTTKCSQYPSGAFYGTTVASASFACSN